MSVETVHSVDEETRHCLVRMVPYDNHSFDLFVHVGDPLDEDDLADTLDEQDNDASADQLDDDHRDKVHVLLGDRNYYKKEKRKVYLNA